MGNRKIVYKGEEYSFSKLKYIKCFEQYRMDHALTKTQLDIQISEICNIGSDAVKKWRGTKDSGTSPSDIKMIERMTSFFGLNSLDYLLSKFETEDNNLMNGLNERQAIKNVIKSFSRLIKVYLKTKMECDNKLLQIAMNNYYFFETSEKEKIVDCLVQFDGENYIYDAIAKEADYICTDLVAESIDLPKEFMDSILMLIHQIVYEDEVEKKYMTESDLKEIMDKEHTHLSNDEIKIYNESLVYHATFKYCERFNEILEKYNVSIGEYIYLMC